MSAGGGDLHPFVVLHHIVAFVVLFATGFFHLFSVLRSHIRASSPPPPRLFYPVPCSSPRLRHLPLHLLLSSLLLSTLLHSFLLPSPSPLLSFQFSLPLLLLSLLCLTLLPSVPILPSDLAFFLASLAFFLLFSASSHLAASFPASDLQSHSSSISSRISLASAILSLTLALSPRVLLPAELALAGTVALSGLWSLHSALVLYSDPFIPDGCHQLLIRSSAIAPTTRCDLDEARYRAEIILDLAFTGYSVLIAIIIVAAYAWMARGSTTAGLLRRHGGGSYEQLPTSATASTGTLAEMDSPQPSVLQMKTIAQE